MFYSFIWYLLYFSRYIWTENNFISLVLMQSSMIRFSWECFDLALCILKFIYDFFLFEICLTSMDRYKEYICNVCFSMLHAYECNKFANDAYWLILVICLKNIQYRGDQDTEFLPFEKMLRYWSVFYGKVR